MEYDSLLFDFARNYSIDFSRHIYIFAEKNDRSHTHVKPEPMRNLSRKV